MGRYLVKLLLTCALLGAGIAQAVEVPELLDLPQLARDSQSRQQPILIMVGATDCEYCKRLEADHLRPMLISQQYEDKVFIRKHMMDKFGYITDFDGSKISYDQFAERYEVDFTPTVIFLNAKGQQVGKRIIGYNGSDFFGARLDKAIEHARKKLHKTL